jgi:hypothetical protein
VDYTSVMRSADMNRSMNRPLFKHLLKSKRAWIVKDNMILDSVWSYEPIELNFTSERVTQVRGMLASSVPMSDVPYDILSYQTHEKQMEIPKWLEPTE